MGIIDDAGHGDAGSRGWDSMYLSVISLPAAFMLAALLSDCLYWATSASLWPRASEWLLSAGLATGAVAASHGLFRYVSTGCIRPSRICWMHVVGNVLASLLSLSNLVYRLNEDSGHAVFPAGISLTAIVVCLLLCTARLGHGSGADAWGDDRDR